MAAGAATADDDDDDDDGFLGQMLPDKTANERAMFDKLSSSVLEQKLHAYKV